MKKIIVVILIFLFVVACSSDSTKIKPATRYPGPPGTWDTARGVR